MLYRFFSGLILIFLISCSNTKISVPTDKKPWSHLNFRDDPNNFQFAIVSDRTGGLRKGIFPKALRRLNEVEGFISYLDMPFFYLAGNHDNGSPLLTKVWKQRFGVEYYHYVYKDVLFLCMNAQDSESFTAVIEEEQQKWAKKVLRENDDVRWTFVFIHQPLWMYEKGLPISESGPLPPRDTGWKEIEKTLQGRKHTVFAGHVHQYVKYSQKAPETNYYTLATTGGGNKLRGAEFGEFDHAMWITMTDNGPKIANLLIDGILPENINTEEMELFRGLIQTRRDLISVEPWKMTFHINFDNKIDKDLTGKIEWVNLNNGWKADFIHSHIDIKKGNSFDKSLKLSYNGSPSNILPLPILKIKLQDITGNPYYAQIKLSLNQLEPYLNKHKIKLPAEFKKEKAKQKKKK
jgi:hypothetical protein